MDDPENKARLLRMLRFGHGWFSSDVICFCCDRLQEIVAEHDQENTFILILICWHYRALQQCSITHENGPNQRSRDVLSCSLIWVSL